MWQKKVDLDLVALTRRPVEARGLVRCLIRVASGRQEDVGRLVASKGGQVRHRMTVVPGLSADLPADRIAAVARNQYVLGIEADQMHRVD